MAKSMADIVAERANPKGESVADRVAKMKADQAAARAAKMPEREPVEDVDQAEAMRRKKDEEAYNKASSAMKKGGKVKKYAKGGSVSASKRADGVAQRGKTRGRMV